MLSYALTTTARVKTFGDINTADDDALIEILIDSATNFVENYCNRRFKQTTHTSEKLDSDGSKFLFLDQYPVDETLDVDLDVRTASNNEEEWDDIDSEDYFVGYDSGIIEIAGGNWIKGKKKYRATYKAGYNYDNAATYLADAGAADLEEAVWKMVLAAYNNRRGDPRVESEKIGQYSVKYRKIAFTDDTTIGAVLNFYAKKDEVLGARGPALY